MERLGQRCPGGLVSGIFCQVVEIPRIVFAVIKFLGGAILKAIHHGLGMCLAQTGRPHP